MSIYVVGGAYKCIATNAKQVLFITGYRMDRFVSDGLFTDEDLDAINDTGRFLNKKLDSYKSELDKTK